ncbi:MAG: NAD(P)-binding domain-containing protein [Actinomycetota bacterium]
MPRDIAVIGAGNVGTALATGLRRVGHRVTLGVRDPADPKHGGRSDGVDVATSAEAAGSADVVVIAVPVGALAELVASLPLRPGQVVVDATNAVRAPVPGGFDTVGAYVASLVPQGLDVVKAFNTIGAEHLDDGDIGGASAFLPVAGDEPGRAVVVELASELGFDVADLGDADAISMVEDHARLWIHLALFRGWGRDFAFSVVRA